jgi:hypothetical protein
VAALTGAGAQRILEREIRKRYPGNEHLCQWRSDLVLAEMWADREEELDGFADADDKPVHLLDFDTPEEFMNAYSRRCDRWRERFDRAKEKVDRKFLLGKYDE